MGRGVEVRRSRVADLCAGALAFCLLAVSAGILRADCADVAIVLAIDASGSVDGSEFLLQRRGYAQAFRSPEVQSALAAAGIVDVAVVQWGDTEIAPQVLSWQRVQTAAEAGELATRIAGMTRMSTGNTGIGRGVATSVDLLQEPGRCAVRKIVNVSGDGIESVTPRSRSFMPLRLSRDQAARAGITINALAIENETTELSDWYRDRLITGPGAFVMEVGGFESFAAAIVEKLAREIAPPAMAAMHADIPPDHVQN